MSIKWKNLHNSYYILPAKKISQRSTLEMIALEYDLGSENSFLR